MALFVHVILDLAIFVELRLVTDRQSDDDSIYRASIASRGKKQAHVCLKTRCSCMTSHRVKY